MKTTNRFAHKLFAGFLALALVTLATRATAEDVAQYITVVKVEGQSRFSTDNGRTWQPVHRGDVLKPGTVIQTAEKSTVDITMGEKTGSFSPSPSPINGPVSAAGAGASGGNSGPKSNVVRIFPSSVLAVDKLVLERTGVDEVSETQLDLRAGQIMGNVKKLSAASRYEVKIPNGVAGIRGTTYVVSATGVVYVLTGQVIISYVGPGGQLITQTVSAGQSFDPFSGGTTPTNGKLSPIPPAVLTALENNYNTLGGPSQTPSTDYTKNATLVHISSLPGP